MLVLGKVGHNSYRILPKYGKEQKGEEKGVMAKEAA